MLPEDEDNKLDKSKEKNESAKDESQRPAERPADFDVSTPKDYSKDVLLSLPGMYRSWFLDYASYVNLERAVPHIDDGLKPVQRRVLYSMKRLDDGRYNKVANIVGHTMQFHPHGDASIGDALVNLGQKDLLIDCQGNWGNVLTGDRAAAPRYIEARLSKFALDVLFNEKTTIWKPSYDGRNQEPVTLPVKFPLLIAQGTEGIGVGLNSKILSHNFNEILDAAISYLKGEDFVLYPDFVTGGSIDVSRYNDGQRGGVVKIRAKISKLDNKTLVINEIPFGTATGSLIDSIVKASEQGKIKIRKVDDNTASNVEILVHLLPSTSSDKTIDALYAFTACEQSISPNCCVIGNNKPNFIGVSDVLRHNVDTTKDLLRRELEIQKNEILEKLFFASLEKIFIEERIYKAKEFEQGKTLQDVYKYIYTRLEPYEENFIRKVNDNDIAKLMEIKMARILKFNSDKADELVAAFNKTIEEVDEHLAHLVEYTIDWFATLKKRYGKNFPRRTEIRNFETIVATKVAEANQKLYVDAEEGFIGTSLKSGEVVTNCSDIDDIIIFFKNGEYKVVRISDKVYVGKNIMHVAVFKKNDKRTVYNAVYRDGKAGNYYIKRFCVTSMTRDKEYDLTQAKEGSRVLYFTANPNGEAEVIRVTLKPQKRSKILVFDKDFSDIAIKGRQSMGNLLSKNDIHRIALKQKGGSTLGGRKVWFDKDVKRLNYDEHGTYLGEFHNEDSILVISKGGTFRTTDIDLNNHYEEDILRIEKFDAAKVWTAAFYDGEQKNKYIKRFQLEATAKPISLLGENADSQLILLSDQVYPHFEVVFGGSDSHRGNLDIEVEEFIGVKSYKARGKRISTFEIDKIVELEPMRMPEPMENEEEAKDDEAKSDEDDADKESIQDIEDEITGQTRLF